MLVILKSPPDSREGKRAVRLARDMAADIVLLQNAVYYAEKDRLEGFCGTVYALDADMRLRGIGDTLKGLKTVGYDGLIDIMANDKAVGIF